jgi:tetratricopeptide (TPR) repeat protein
MRRLLAERRAQRRTCLLFVHGPEGIGRTSLVSEFFHEDPSTFDGTCVEVAARQPDGRLVPQGELLGQLLRGLGMADTEQPSSDAARLDAFQRLSAGRRFLIVIRDAASAEQVRNLIPAAAPDAAVVVTTRTMQRDLLTQDFVDVPLSKLPRAESRELLVHCMGPGAAQVSSATIDELADLCDGFPLLIRILGAQLVRRSHAAERYLRDLRVSGSALLTMDHSQRMAGFLNVTYDFLVRDLQVAYRRLSLLPGPGFNVDAAAVALELDVSRAERLLDDLVDTNLLLLDEGTGRYSFYRIVRADAQRRALEVDGPEVVRSTTELITMWYLREAVPRDAALANRWRVGAEFDRYAATNPEPVSRVAATLWFDAEWTSLVACVRAAQDQRLHAVAWQLCVVVFKYLHLHGHVDAWLDSHQLGVASAQTCGDQLGVMQLTSQLGAAYLAVGDIERARADFEASLRAAVRSGHRLGEQSAWEWLGKTAAAAGDADTAFRCYDESQAVIEQSGAAIPAEQQARMQALLGLQRARARLIRGEGERAETEAAAALEYFTSTNELDNQAKCLMVMGEAASGGHDFAKAAHGYEHAAALFAADGTRRAQASALSKLGDARDAAGDYPGAVEALGTSRELYIVLGDATADVVGARLSDLNGRRS